MELPKRKGNRLECYNYSDIGTYFITICTQNRKKILSNIIVGTGVLDCPKIVLMPSGQIVDRYINQLNDFYDNISIDKYVIMPDHIHLLITITKDMGGQSGTPVPTDVEYKIDNTNSVISKFVSTFKRFCNKDLGQNIWQQRYYDHIIRNEKDYIEICEYIDSNPAAWALKREQ